MSTSTTPPTAAARPSGSTRLPTLAELAQVPLHRFVSSCAISSDGTLGTVGCIGPKAEAAKKAGLLGFGVCEGQTYDDDAHVKGELVGDTTTEGLSVVHASTVGELLLGFIHRVGPEIYGSAQDLPDGLRDSEIPLNPSQAARFDYHEKSFFPLKRLNELAKEALFGTATPWQGDLSDAPEVKVNDVYKFQNKGYFFVLGTAGCGKTSWALDWVRYSRNQFSAPKTGDGARARLAGWFFARRYSSNGTEIGGKESSQSEYWALQTLISMARRQRDVKATKSPLELLSEEEQRDYSDKYSAKRHKTVTALRENFKKALFELAEEATEQDPIVLLLDGCDEMWQAGAGTHYLRTEFPKILPKATKTELPEHVYIIMLGRPGQYIDWNKSTEPNAFRPLLQYEFTPDSVADDIRDFLNERANEIDSADISRSLKSEAPKYLRDRDFQKNVCLASGGAFGYAPLLMRQWLPNKATHDIKALKEWKRSPDRLPKGVYGIRARELLAVESNLRSRKVKHLLPQNDKVITLTEVLATLALLRTPMTAKAFMDLMHPETVVRLVGEKGKKRPHLQALLEVAGQFLVHSRNKSEPLQFGHQSFAEVALSAWRLKKNQEHPISESELTQESLAKSVLTEEQRMQADARLHANLAHLATAHWRDQDDPKPSRPWIKPGETVEPARAYALLWGPWHALTAAASPNAKTMRTLPLGQRARSLLVDATYLQSVIRVGGDASLDSLRKTYIAADRVSGIDPNSVMRRDVEISMLHWHEHISHGRAQVGVVLWNLLGDTDQGKNSAQQWKKSLDEPALITKQPGRPMDLARRLGGFEHVTLSPCGRWMATLGQAGTAVWDMRDGAHRPHRIALMLQWFHVKQCTAVDQQICLAGWHGNDIILALVDVRTGSASLVRYGGHDRKVSDVALHATADRVVVASGSDDSTVGVLSLGLSEILAHASAQSRPGAVAQTGKIARYGGHEGTVSSIALHATDKRVVVAGSWDQAVGLLSLSLSEIADEAEAQNNPVAQANTGKIARYSGHKEHIHCIALHATDKRVVVASGSMDGMIGVLSLNLSDVVAHASAQNRPDAIHQTGKFPIYGKHDHCVTSIALHVTDDRVLVASGSWDRTVGLLSLSLSDIAAHAETQRGPGAQAQPGQLARYGGHERIDSIALHATDKRVLVASGSWDQTVGLLSLSLSEIGDHANTQSRPEAVPQTGKIARYRGHNGTVSSIALHATDKRVVVASGSWDQTVGLLSLSLSEIIDRAEAQRESRAPAQPGQLARYKGHEGWVRSIALLATDEKVLVASGSADTTVGLLNLTLSDIWTHASAQSSPGAVPHFGHVARYKGHEKLVESVALHTTDEQRVLVASGSDDSTVGLLSLNLSEIADHAQAQHEPGAQPKPGLIARYGGHEGDVCAVALHATDEQMLVASGSDDNTVGLLSLKHTEVAADALAQCELGAQPKPGLIARYKGHEHVVWSIALHATDEQVLVASGSFDDTVGLLSLKPTEVAADALAQCELGAQPKPGLIARYKEHNHPVRFVSLHATAERALVASGSADQTVGLLSLSRFEIEENCREQHHLDTGPKSGRSMCVELNVIGAAKWRASRIPLPDHAHSLQWLGLADEAVLMSPNIMGDVPSAPTIISAVCPFYDPGFAAFDIEQIDACTFVVGGAYGLDVALMLLEWVTPSKLNQNLSSANSSKFMEDPRVIP